MTVLPLLFNDPERWRKRADEVRAIARKMTDRRGKEAMLAVAAKYDQLAERAQDRLAGKL